MHQNIVIGKMSLQTGDALLVVDVQNDFLPGGSLAVPGGDEVIPVLNHYLATFGTHGLSIFATRNWHPPEHCSFHAQGGPWPVHCRTTARTLASSNLDEYALQKFVVEEAPAYPVKIAQVLHDPAMSIHAKPPESPRLE